MSVFTRAGVSGVHAELPAILDYGTSEEQLEKQLSRLFDCSHEGINETRLGLSLILTVLKRSFGSFNGFCALMNDFIRCANLSTFKLIFVTIWEVAINNK